MSASAGCLLDRFFILLTFPGVHTPGANNPNPVPPFGETDNQQPPLGRMSEHQEAEFANRMFAVLEIARQWIGKHCRGLDKTHPVFEFVLLRFLRIPLKRYAADLHLIY